MRKIFYSILIISSGLFSGNAMAAAARGPAVINTTGTIAAKVTSSTLYSEACYNSYFGCMNEFCMSDNADGGRCQCSNENAAYEKALADIELKIMNANELRTIEVEKVEAGANVDIIFSGNRQYDAAGNVIRELSAEDKKAQDKANRRRDLLAMFDDVYEEDSYDQSITQISDMTGDALYSSAHDLCVGTVPPECSGEMTILSQLYSTQIKSDCRAFDLTVKNMQRKADAEFADAQKAVRDARLESFQTANKYDLGTCMLEFRRCMSGVDVCGSDWSRCVSTVAQENMQNQKTASTAGTAVDIVVKYDISASTMELLDSRRTICENVLNQCVAVRDMVWPAFIREVATDLKTAELNAESKMRQSCLSDISNCVQKACQDDIVGKGTATMDACLSRPDMARSFCKIQIDPCERMEPQIWSYVVDKLAAMRVDRCTEEVRECFTSEDRCGSDFMNCIGMDYDYMHDICPIDSLVVCKQGNPNFSMEDIDRMLMGFYLNVDNSALENCQNLIDTKMIEVCGSTTDCNNFAADDTIGTGSLRSQKLGDVYRVTGMISFGGIQMGDGTLVCDGEVGRGGCTEEFALKPGEIGIENYLTKVKSEDANVGVPNRENILESIEVELENIKGTINRVMDLIEKDQRISYCVNGRDLSQITGNAESTTARFPNLLTHTKMLIATSALRKAQDNYNTKLNEMISDATKNASADIAQYMCQKMAENGSDGGMPVGDSTPLVPAFAISYDVGAGLRVEDLTLDGHNTSTYGEMSMKTSRVGGNVFKASGGGVTRETWAVFSRETRNCRLCTSTTIQDCKTTGRKGWFKDTRGTECTSMEPIEQCQDIPM